MTGYTVHGRVMFSKISHEAAEQVTKGILLNFGKSSCLKIMIVKLILSECGNDMTSTSQTLI